MPFGKRQRDEIDEKRKQKKVRRKKKKKTPEADALAAVLGRLLNIWVGLK